MQIKYTFTQVGNKNEEITREQAIEKIANARRVSKSYAETILNPLEKHLEVYGDPQPFVLKNRICGIIISKGEG